MPTEGDFFNLLGKLDITLGKMNEQTERQLKLQQLAKRSTVPSKVVIHGKTIVPASGFAVIGLDHSGPNQGYYWNVRRLSISGITPSTAVGGRADVFVSAMPYGQITDFSQIGMADWADQAETLPLVGNYGEGELQLICPERLHIIVSGATSGDTIVVNGVAQQVQESAAKQEWQI